jgi:hypothetical protein
MMSRANFRPPPTRRPLRVYAFDPSRGKRLGNEMQIDVQYRDLKPGPADISKALDRIAVVDYDLTHKKYYRPIDLDDPSVLLTNGLAPSEADPGFHQQMVYAVASDTIEQFERVLGRRIHWRRQDRPKNAPKGWLPEDILCLSLYPHAMCQANAYYSPQAHGILFGYFRAGGNVVGTSIPGQPVFTCLSHDVIVHEMTHAIIDGLRSHFMEQTNPDVAAFHEGFADLVALFRHFTHREVLLDAIQRTGGRLYTPALKGDPLADLAGQSGLGMGDDAPNPLIELAAQFGESMGSHAGLRSAIGTPKTMKELQEPMDCHERGSILVAAVFEAFFDVYLRRAAKLFRIYRSASGVNRDDLTSPLADALCDEATGTAEEFFRICVRALDYLPPVDVTFGDFLRAVMTSESDYDPEDCDGIRDAWLQAFRRREILPNDATFFSVDGLCWPQQSDLIKVENLPFGGPLGLTYEQRQQTSEALYAFIAVPANRKRLGLAADMEVTIPSFHPVFRADRAGSVRWDLVVEMVQTPEPPAYPVRGGTTVILSTHSTAGGGEKGFAFLRYAICKPVHGRDGLRRADQHAAFFEQQGIKPGGKASDLRINFALVHGDT